MALEKVRIEDKDEWRASVKLREGESAAQMLLRLAAGAHAAEAASLGFVTGGQLEDWFD